MSRVHTARASRKSQPNAVHVAVNKVLALRETLGLTQAKFAARAGLSRLEVVALESGKNKASTVRVLSGVAKVAGVGLDTMRAYMRGEVDIGVLLARRGEAPVDAATDPDVPRIDRARSRLMLAISEYLDALEATIAGKGGAR